MSFGDDGIFGIYTPWIVLLLSMIWASLGLWTIVIVLEDLSFKCGLSRSSDFLIIVCLVLVFFPPVSALSCSRKCHQEVSVPSFNA